MTLVVVAADAETGVAAPPSGPLTVNVHHADANSFHVNAPQKLIVRERLQRATLTGDRNPA